MLLSHRSCRLFRVTFCYSWLRGHGEKSFLGRKFLELDCSKRQHLVEKWRLFKNTVTYQNLMGITIRPAEVSIIG